MFSIVFRYKAVHFGGHVPEKLGDFKYVLRVGHRQNVLLGGKKNPEGIRREPIILLECSLDTDTLIYS